MAKDRIFFLISFAFLGLVAAYTFSGKELPKAPAGAPGEAPAAPVIEKKVDVKILDLTPGKVAVPIQLNSRSGIVNFMNPGDLIEILFTTKSDVGFGSITLSLLKDIRILGIGKDNEGKFFNDKASFYRANSPVEILVEMTPKQAEIMSYAENSGTVSLGITEFSGKKNEAQTEHADLVEKLIKADSEVNFNSVLVTHLIKNLFPDAHINVIATAKGYIVSGTVQEEQTSSKITKVLELLASEGSKAVVNLIEVGGGVAKALDSKEEAVDAPRTTLKLAEGKRAIPIKLNTRSPIIPFLTPGLLVDVKFISRPDIGFDPVSVLLLKNIRVISIGSDSNDKSYIGKPFNGEERFYRANAVIEVFLEVSPREAEILSFSELSGSNTLELAGIESDDHNLCLVEQLFGSESLGEFQSTLVTYMIRTLFPAVDIRVLATPKGYIVEGKVPDPQMGDKIMEILVKLVPGGERAVINMMDIEPQQVLLCVKVVEVEKRVLSKIGINWQVLFQTASQSIALGAVYPPVAAFDADYFVNGAGQYGNYNLSAVIDMLEQDGVAKILAQPNLTTVSGVKANFFSGGEFPILIPQGGALLGTVTVEFKKYGIMLDFTPEVDLNGLISLHVAPEVSNLDKENAVVLQGFIIPSILTRRVDTVVKLWPGQSYLIAGLYSDESVNREDNLYGLNKIPLLGSLFGSNRYEDVRQELLIMLTPYLINNAAGFPPPPANCLPEYCSQAMEREEVREQGWSELKEELCNSVEEPVLFVETPWD